jgi:hypothetical protein
MSVGKVGLPGDERGEQRVVSALRLGFRDSPTAAAGGPAVPAHRRGPCTGQGDAGAAGPASPAGAGGP